MQTIGAFQAKTYFSRILEQVENGDQIVITKHGRPVAKLIPISSVDQSTIAQTIEQMEKFCEKHSLGGLDWKTLRDEGRK